ncbi:unnamed protein product [Rotaria sordida]|uniref:F-box domain-containing protein n=1 Tax=Rotaria sordida TaxID=392033 RepID=A0A815I903_9BILA|nr:unnamed protein product [Rotaria sordida]
MNQSDIHLVDLPNEILLMILKRLDNINVLYSLMGTFDGQFDILLQDNIFTNTLNMISRSSTDNDDDDIYSIDDQILDRFCIDILPKIHHNVKHLILESMSMKRILLAGNYPNLTSLKLFNFGQNIALNYFTDKSIFQHIFKYQITELILENNDNYDYVGGRILSKEYNNNIYVSILSLFKNLQSLSIVGSFTSSYPPLSIVDLPSITFCSSILTKLCINVRSLDDCLYLLDGRLKQLTIFIVQIRYIYNDLSIIHNTDDLSNLKYFSLTCYNLTNAYDNRMIPLFRRMINLEKLTLYIRITDRHTFVDGTHLHKEILMHMLQLHTFIFYISTIIQINDLVHRLSNNDIQQTFKNIGYYQTSCTVSYCRRSSKAICHVFSLPFAFDRLEVIINRLPIIIFHHITYLTVICNSLITYNENACSSKIVIPSLFSRQHQLFTKKQNFLLNNSSLITYSNIQSYEQNQKSIYNIIIILIPLLIILVVLIVSILVYRNVSIKRCSNIDLTTIRRRSSSIPTLSNDLENKNRECCQYGSNAKPYKISRLPSPHNESIYKEVQRHL